MKQKRSFALIIIIAVMLFTACTAPESPVGESKYAELIRNAVKSGAETEPETSGPENNEVPTAGISARSRTAEGEGTASKDAVTEGDPKGVHLELWTYDDAHTEYYRKLLSQWNDQNPDYTLEISFSKLSYDELHEKLRACLESGKGAPDICDVDAYRFSDMSEGRDEWLYPLDVALAPYLYETHAARINVYRGPDNKRYGVPFRMGAVVQYWNLEALEQAGISQKDIDSVVSWEDYTALAEKYAASVGGGRYFTAVEDKNPVLPMLAVAEYSGETNNADEAEASMKTLYQGWLDSGIAKATEDISNDIKSQSIVSFTESLAYMDRFVKDMHDESGKWYITRCPVFSEEQPCSVCLDDTVTVITAQSKAAPLAADFICFSKLYKENAKTILWPELSYDICNTTLWEDEEFAHDPTNEYNTFFRSYPYDVLKEIKDRIATVKP
ncbi:MAG: extracellular solute-binding protein [Lachnospiraceae bacterium]|nr:extracellular solute-binding protein [Lachnospiraceae bacterium]